MTVDRRRARFLRYCGEASGAGRDCVDGRRAGAPARPGSRLAAASRRAERRGVATQECPVCGVGFVSLRETDHIASGCFLGLLVGSILDREELDFGDRELHRLAGSGFGFDWLWEGFGATAADALEDLLVECGANRKEVSDE
ncbi:MAG TPA: hypothetical protein VHB53_00460 [Solirubrobacterales bacterium]|nr:hypothetical protein [Solirubrobacterales bacterium]